MKFLLWTLSAWTLVSATGTQKMDDKLDSLNIDYFVRTITTFVLFSYSHSYYIPS